MAETAAKEVADRTRTIPELNAVVVQRQDYGPGLMILRVAPDGWELPEFKAGQYAVLGLPATSPRCAQSEEERVSPPTGRLIRRAYSIASASVQREYLEFYVVLVRSGSLTPRLFALTPGDRVWLGPRITGMFTLADVPTENHIVLVATGTGLAPYMSMLRTHLEAGGPRRFAALHGAAHSFDLGYSTELFTLQRLCPNFAYLPIIDLPDEEPVAWRGPVGFVQSLWRSGAVERAWGFPPTPADTHVFLCGNPNMVTEMRTILSDEGYSEHGPAKPGQIHVETYW